MVSLLNNTSIRLCFSKEASLPQYPYFLYDPAYQNQMNSQNLLYSQNPPETEPKKSKTSKKKGENEKNAKEASSSLDCTKEEITSWLRSLTLEERFEAFSIKSNWLAVALAKMYRRRAESLDITFRLLPEENTTNGERNGLEFSDLETHFYCRRSLVEKQIHIDKAEERLVQNIRIYDDNDFYNVIVFRDDLLQNIEEVLQLFDIISGKKAFSKPCHSASEHKSSTINVDKPGWFKSNEFATLGEWIVSSFEKAIWTKYMQNKKASSKYPSAFEALDSRLTLNYKKSLTEFWSGLEKSKKKKIAATANETYKWLNSPDSEQKCYESGKDINQCLKKLYEGPLFAQSKATTTAESISSCFSHLMEDKNDHVVIESILMTTLWNFGTITSLICRKLAHKLKNMLSEKIAADLILNEEREKKNPTKKKSKKKKAKKPTQPGNSQETTDTAQVKKEEGEGIVEEDKQENFSTTSLQNRVQVEDDLVVEDISDEEIVSKTAHSTSRKISEAKEETKLNNPPVTSSKNKKKNSQNNEKTKVQEEVKVQAKNEKQEEKISKTENENKNVEEPKKNEIDSWSQFDEFDKKVTKSQKRKMKKKQKNLEQEKLKAQENQTENQNENENEKEKEEIMTENKRESSIEKMKENIPLTNENKETKEIELAIIASELTSIPSKTEQRSKKSKKENQPSELKPAQIVTNKKENETQRSNTAKSPAKTLPAQKVAEIKAKSPRKEEPIIKNVSMPPPIDDSEFGFIEVKAKKKHEKEVPQKERRDRESKGNSRRKKQKEESDNRKAAKGIRRPKSPVPAAEAKKEHNEAPSSKATVIEKNVVVKCIVGETSNKSNIGIPKVITGAALASKALSSKSQKKETMDVQLEGSSNSSEGEGTPCNTRNTSHTSRSSHNPNRSPNEPCTESVPERKYSANNNNNKSHRGHPLSLASPSLDLETIKTAQAKDYANKFFTKKFENDIYKYVSALTDEANKMTDFRIIAYRRLDYCIASLFPNFNVQTKIFGSCATGLALITSDIDISVSGLEAYDRFALGDYLLLISNALEQFKWITVNEPILTASVPILKLEIDLNLKFGDIKECQNSNKLWNIPTDNKDELDIEENTLKEDFKIRVDLSLESLGMGYNYHLGYKTTAFVQRMLAKYESLYIVTMVLKQFLHTRKLLNIYKGGLSSYCLVIMIVALLQKFGDEGYMTTLRRFFNFYGEVFKPESQGISLIDKDPFFSLGHSYETAPFWIIVDNNFGRKNIGQGVYSIKAILHEFAEASHKIESTRKRVEESAAKNHNAVHSVDDITKLENDPETQALLNSNILELIINCP